MKSESDMVYKNPGEERLAELYFEARNAGILTAKKYLEPSSRPKNPTDRARRFISLLDELNSDQRSRLIEGIRYCTDISMFKLLCLLEDSDFRLSVDGESKTLIGPDKDNELRMKYWQWEEKRGR
jgi:hypothetical protein